MRKIAILTDSSSDIPQELADKYGIEVMGFSITLDDKSYIERKDVTFDEFYELMRTANGVPTTAAITQIQFCEKFCQYVDKGYTDVLLVVLNSAGSSTFNNAQMALKMLNEEWPGNTLNVQIVDSHTYSMTFGWYLCEAARKLRNGAELKHIVAWLNDQYRRVEICLAAFSLKQMKKSGRVSAAAAFAGELLGLRPIIALNQGISKVENKVRGDAAVLPAMIKHVRSHVGTDLSGVEYQVAWTDNAEQRDALVRLCKKEFGHPPLTVFKLGGVVSANTGPDALALIYLRPER